MAEFGPSGADFRWMPDEWFVFFWRGGALGWPWRLVPGEFKHVSAAGFVEKARAWVFVNPVVTRLEVEVIPDDMVDLRLLVWAKGNLVLKLRGAPIGSMPRFGFWCTPIVAHIVGNRGCALRPDALLRHLRSRAEWVRDDAEAGYEPVEARGGAFAPRAGGDLAAEAHALD